MKRKRLILLRPGMYHVSIDGPLTLKGGERLMGWPRYRQVNHWLMIAWFAITGRLRIWKPQ